MFFRSALFRSFFAGDDLTNRWKNSEKFVIRKPEKKSFLRGAAPGGARRCKTENPSGRGVGEALLCFLPGTPRNSVVLWRQSVKMKIYPDCCVLKARKERVFAGGFFGKKKETTARKDLL
jgi:hypothetical protein